MVHFATDFVVVRHTIRQCVMHTIENYVSISLVYIEIYKDLPPLAM